MAQDVDSDVPLSSHALDLVTLPGGPVPTEMEADMIRGLLDSSGIPSLVLAAAEFPALGFEIRVPRGQLVEAERLIKEAQASGSEAATEAESETEK